ncbi:hypothetical protein V2K64_07745 [Pseudomonas alliivorans]|uniref:hypothetical protein n=2 Tax=Pseudomonas TaxID=286 RepID=UPI00233E80A9|nr:hypothetical protein [Pseudomonas syringae]MEE4888651.1 hypothetical protein [Pseudomonas alliivorans]MEE4892826.1 hypothetical protein [Pseudomonas alliivorans]
MWDFFKDRSERKLCAWAVGALLSLCMVKAKFPAMDYMLSEWPWVVAFFQSKAFEDIVGDLLTGLIAAYFFYVVIDVIPRLRKEKQTMEVLNRLVASVVDSYAKAHWFGHTMAITHVNLDYLKLESLHKMIEEVKQDKASFGKLKCALFTAHSRYSDFSSTLNLAGSMGSGRALQWLVLTDKVRLLVDNYEAHPESDEYDASHVFGSARSEIDDTAVDFLQYESALNGFMESLQFGVLEYLEQARSWISPVPANDPSNAPTDLNSDGNLAAG